MKNFYRMLLSMFLTLCIGALTFAQPTQWHNKGIGGGGALFAPSINPANSDEFYVSCDMTDAFHTTNFGQSYTIVDFNKLQGGNYGYVRFTSNPLIRYAINHEPLDNEDFNGKLAKTTNGGNTWDFVPSSDLYITDDLYSLHVDYNNPNRVIVAYYDVVLISNDGGVSFQQIIQNGSGVIVGGVFFDGDNIYMGTSRGLLVSEDGGNSFSNKGNLGIPTAEGIFSFAGAKEGNTIRFFCVTSQAGSIYPGIPIYDDGEYTDFTKGIYVLEFDNTLTPDKTWNLRTNGLDLTNNWPLLVAMAENNINTVYLSGASSSSNPIVFKTANAGADWQPVFTTLNNGNIVTGWSGHGGDRDWSYGEVFFGLAVAPSDANKVIVTDFGFVHKTSNGGVSWNQAYVNQADEHPALNATPQKQSYQTIGLENTSCWQVYWIDQDNMFAAYSDMRALRSTDGGVKWSFNYNGLPANTTYRIVKANNSNTLYAATSRIHDIYQSPYLIDARLNVNDADGAIRYSTDNGQNWSVLTRFQMTNGTTTKTRPIFWIATDPTRNNRMYASVVSSEDFNGSGQIDGGIYITNDLNNGTSTWQQLPTPAGTEGHPASIVVLNDGKVVCTFSGRKTGSTTFTPSSGVFVYTPGSEATPHIGGTWENVSHTDMRFWTKDIVVDPNDPTQNTWYVGVFSNNNGLGGLYRTVNRGISWTKLTNSGDIDRVTSITIDPNNGNQAFVTTENDGLWFTTNLNDANPTFTQLTNFHFRQPERVFFNPFNTTEVWVTTFGNGMYVGTMPVATPVQLTSFTASLQNKNDVVLEWKTASELNNKHFILERKAVTASAWQQITVVNSKGNSSAEAGYDFTDLNVGNGTWLYRLSQVDVDNKRTYFNTVGVTVSNEGKVQVYPTRTTGVVNIYLPVVDEYIVTITDVNGKQCKREIFKGNQRILNVQSLSAGTYFLTVNNHKNQIITKEKIIKIN